MWEKFSAWYATRRQTTPELHGMQRIKFDIFNELLSKVTEAEDKLNVLKQNYPGYFRFFMEQNGMKEEVNEFIEESRKLKDCPATQYSRYVHGCLLPTLAKH